MIVILILAAAANQFFLANLNSDYLYLYETANNIFHYHSIAGQNFPAAPYYFPDLFLVMILQLFIHNITIIHFLYSCLFLAAFLYGIFLLIYFCTNNKPNAYFSASVALLISFSIMPTQLSYLHEWPASHLSALLCSLFLLYFYLKQAFTPVLFGLAMLATFLVFISDNLLFAQCIVPLCFLICIDLLRHHVDKKYAYLFLASLLCIVLLGARMDLFLSKYFDASFSLNISLFRIRKIAQLPLTLQHAMQIIRQTMTIHAFFYYSLLFYNCINIVLMLGLRNMNLNLKRVLCYLYAAQFFNLILAILAGKFTDPMHLRYLDTIFIFPFIIFALLISQYLTRNIYPKLILLILSCVIVMSTIIFIQNNVSFLQQINLQPPYNHFVACMDTLQQTEGIKNGLGEYWDVREIRMLSKRNINMTQINNELDFFNFLDHDKLFYPREYDFIVVSPNAFISPLPKDKIEQVVGKPDKIAMCSYREIWVYNSPESRKRLNLYFGPKSAVIHRS